MHTHTYQYHSESALDIRADVRTFLYHDDVIR